jgi:hypothetical protein
LLEQKCDTMFDIIQNVAKELKQIKTPVLQPVFRDVVEERIKYDMNEVEEEVQEDDDETATMASEDKEEESESESERETEEIVANKLEVFDLGEIQTELSTDTPTDYKKMSVPALKKLVLAKGLRNDVGGLKKADLLGLLA